MSTDSDRLFFTKPFRKHVLNNDYDSLKELLDSLIDIEIGLLRIDITFDPIKMLLDKHNTHSCLELLLEKEFSISRVVFIEMIANRNYTYLDILLDFGAKIDKSIIVLVGHNGDISILDIIFPLWQKTNSIMDYISFNFLKFNKYDAFKWCLDNEDFKVNINRCKEYANQNELESYINLLS